MAEVLIIGAGIAGLSLAYHLQRPHRLYEKNTQVGGLCRSAIIEGCTFDYAPKVFLSGSAYATALNEKLLGDNLQYTAFSDWSYHHEFGGVYTRTPIQKHLYGLPDKEVLQILAGMAEVIKKTEDDSPITSYRDWLYKKLGRPLANRVIVPQERKKWKSDPADMDYQWATARVPRPDLATAILGATTDIPQSRTFGYTQQGGVAALMEAMAEHIPHLHLQKPLQKIQVRQKVAIFADGEQRPFDTLVSTIPLPLLVNMLDEAPTAVRHAAQQLKHLSLTCVCLVIKRPQLSDKHFVYVHEPQFIFHRLSFISNLSPQMAPQGYSTILAEVSYVDQLTVSPENLVEEVRDNLITMNILQPDDDIVAHDLLPIPYAYPRQTPNRQAHVQEIQAYLQRVGIISFGRNGEWEYYNMHDIVPRARDLAQQLDGATT